MELMKEGRKGYAKDAVEMDEEEEELGMGWDRSSDRYRIRRWGDEEEGNYWHEQKKA